MGKIDTIVHEIRGNPHLIEEYDEIVPEFTVSHWLYLLNHRPNDECIVCRCKIWMQFNVDDLCDLFCAHPQLRDTCPDEAFLRMKRGHWAKLIMADGVFAQKLEDLGLTEQMIGDWCCPYHWAEKYITIYSVRVAAASPHEHQIVQIAEQSAINPSYVELGRCGHHSTDLIIHIKWLASIAQDAADMAAVTDEVRAQKYHLIAEAALYQINKLRDIA